MGKSTTTTQNSAPWAPSQPALQDILGSAQSMYGAGGFNVTPTLSGETMQGVQGLGAPSMITAPTQSAYLAALGQGSNPNLGALESNITGQTMSALNSMGLSGDNGLNQQFYAKSIASALAPTEYNAWQQQQQNQQNLLGMAPMMQGLGAQDAMNALRGGSVLDQYSTAKQQAPINALKTYAGLAQGIGGMGGSQTSMQSMPWYAGLGGIGQLMSGLGGFMGAF